MAIGNSDSDLQMLQWTTAGAGPRFGLIVRHTDSQREYAYDRLSSIGQLDKALDEAASRGWIVVDMRNVEDRLPGAASAGSAVAELTPPAPHGQDGHGPRSEGCARARTHIARQDAEQGDKAK